MTDTFIAQCPHCQSNFRVKHSQLDIARGAVRCGACLKVFNAASQLTAPRVQSNPPLNNNEVAARSSSTVLRKRQFQLNDDIDLGDLNLDDEIARLEREEQQPKVDSTALTPRISVTAELENTNAAQPDKPTDTLSTATQNTSEVEVEVEVEITQPDTEDIATPATPTYTLKATADDSIAQPAAPQRLRFDDEPLRLDWRPKQKPWKRWLVWILVYALAALLVLSLYIYGNFAQLARQDSTRAWLEPACQLFGCQLPSKVDVQQIKSSNLVVRDHPEFSAAVLVDAIIYNRAAFSQPFPLIELVFSDPHGEPVVRRVFKPVEYLSGELAGDNQMPPQTPIHIALETLQPDGGVINYTLNFISPN
ncbi:MAG: DUF3426 domain-containing protein [Pseudomonas sp.]|nr:DUF3426 domain-containing protein [Pseudomonas sp.]